MRKLARHAAVANDILLDVAKIDDGAKADAWDKSRKKCITSFKAAVLEDGLNIQDHRCAWCTLLVGAAGRRSAHRDHIAPKRKHPKWTFLPINLVIACEYCNGFSVKNDLETVDQAAAIYSDSSFHVIHPYLDEPSDHVKFTTTATGPGVTIKGVTAKGRWTIAKLKLDNPGLTVQRAQDFMYLQAVGSLPKYYRELLNEATGRVG